MTKVFEPADGWQQVRSTLAVAALMTLAACGGGGGGDSASGGSGGGVATATVSGVASKGLLKHAVVKVYEVNSDGTVSTTVLATGETADDGTYTLTGIPTGKTVVVKITAGASTKMADEATGQDIDVPSDFSLRAVQKVSASSETVLVTPYSEMAASIAQANGGFTDDGVTAAVAQVKMFAGDKVFTDAPTFDSNNKPKNASAAALAAVSKLAADGDVTECASASGQAAKVKCVVEQMATKGTTDTALANKLNTKLTVVTSDPGYTGEVAAPISKSDRVTINDETKNAVKAAKDLIASVRNTIQSMSDKASNASLVSRAKAVANAVDGSLVPLDRSTRAVIAAATEALNVMDDPVGFGSQIDPSTGKVTLSTSQALAAGCQFYTDNTFATSSVQATGFLGCRVTHRLVTGTTLYAIQHRIQLLRSTADHYTIKTALIKQTGVMAFGSFQRDNTAATSLSGGAVTSYTAEVSRAAGTGVSPYNVFALTGDLAPGVKNGAALGTKQHVAVVASQEAVPESTLTQLNLSGVFDVYDGSTLVTSVGLQDGSYVRAHTTLQGDVTGPSGTNVTGDVAHLVLGATSSTGAKVVGTLDESQLLSTDVESSGGVVWPVLSTFQGYVTEADGITKLFDGTLTLNFPANDAVTTMGWHATLQGTLVTSGAGSVALNLSLAESSTTADLMSFSGSYQTADDHVSVSGSFTRGAGDGTLTFTDVARGVSFTFHDGDEKVSIVKNEAVVGVFTRGNSRLVFADNSYEQF